MENCIKNSSSVRLIKKKSLSLTVLQRSDTFPVYGIYNVQQIGKSLQAVRIHKKLISDLSGK